MEITIYVAISIFALIRFLLCVTTKYEFNDDFLIIFRLGTEWRRIHFKDIEAIEVGYAFLDQFSQLVYFQPRFGKMTRIRKKGLNKYILINPKDPQLLVKAFERYNNIHSSHS